jgi:hypothetical protein
LEEDEILKIIIGRIQKNLDKRNRLKEETYWEKAVTYGFSAGHFYNPDFSFINMKDNADKDMLKKKGTAWLISRIIKSMIAIEDNEDKKVVLQSLMEHISSEDVLKFLLSYIFSLLIKQFWEIKNEDFDNRINEFEIFINSFVKK